MNCPPPPSWPSTYHLAIRTTVLPSLPHGRTVRIGDYARTCVQRKTVALALNASNAATVKRERQLALIILILAIAGLFSE